MKYLQWVLLLFAIGKVSFAAPPDFDSKMRFTLSDSIRYALSHSPSIDTANKNRIVGQLQYRNAVSKLFPSLDLNTTNGLQNNIPVTTNYFLIAPNQTAPWCSSLTLGITENIYDNGSTFLEISNSEKNQEITAIANLKARASLIQDIAIEFYKFSLLSTLVKVRQQQLDILEKQFSLLSAQYRQGLKPRLDFLRFKAQVQRAQIERTTTELNKEVSESNLTKLLGVDIHSKVVLNFEPIPVKPGVLQLLSKDPPPLEDYFDYKTTQLQRKVNENAVTLARLKYWPQVTLGAGVTYSNVNYLNSDSSFFTGGQLSYNALLTFQYNIWDWGIRRRDIEIAEHNRDVQDNQLNSSLLDVRNQMNTLMLNISRVKENYTLTQELLRNEEKNYQDVDLQYKEGKVAYLDLITSLTNLLDAKVQFYTVHYEALQVLAQYQFYEGSIYEKLVEQGK